MEKSKHAVVKLLEGQFKAIIQDVGYRVFISALHNACAHGDVFNNDISDADLAKMFDNYDNLIEIANRFS